MQIDNYEYNRYDYMTEYDFNTVPLWKCAVLFVLFPLSILWWSYRLWQKVAISYSNGVSPFLRTCFMFIYNFPLFKTIERHANRNGVKFIIGSNWIATLYIVVPIILCFIYGFNNFILDVIYDLIVVSPFIYIQYKINEVNKKNYPDAYVEKWDFWDSIFAIFGLVFRIIGIILNRK